MRPPSCARVRYAGGKLRGAARRCVAEVRPCQFWGLPVTFAATSTTIKSSAAFDGRTIPTFVDARPTQPLLTSRKVYATAHATRAARPTSSSRRAAVRRPRACPARYDAGRFVRPVTICELAGGCTDGRRLTAPGAGRGVRAQSRDIRPTRRRSEAQPATARGVVRAWARTDRVPLSTEGTSLLRLRDRCVRRARRPAIPRTK